MMMPASAKRVKTGQEDLKRGRSPQILLALLDYVLRLMHTALMSIDLGKFLVRCTSAPQGYPCYVDVIPFLLAK